MRVAAVAVATSLDLLTLLLAGLAAAERAVRVRLRRLLARTERAVAVAAQAVAQAVPKAVTASSTSGFR